MAGSPPIDRISVDEHRRFYIKIVMLMRVDMRELFGMEVANRWGFWVDRYLSKQVREFADWIPYPKGDHVLEGCDSQVYAAVVSDDGYFLFTGDAGGMIEVWNMLDNQVIREWKAHDKTVHSLAFKSRLLVSGSDDATIKIWDTWHDYGLVQTFEGHRRSVNSVDINDGATQVISASWDCSIRIWSVNTGECIRVMMGHSKSVSSVQFIGNLILSGSYDQSIKVWNPPDGTEIHSVNEGIDHRIFDLNMNYDASMIACSSLYALTLFTWPELKYIRNIHAKPSHCAFHPTHSTILFLSQRKHQSIFIFDLTNYDVIRTLEGHSDSIKDICFTPDGSRLVSVSLDKSVRIWDVSDV